MPIELDVLLVELGCLIHIFLEIGLLGLEPSNLSLQVELAAKHVLPIDPYFILHVKFSNLLPQLNLVVAEHVVHVSHKCSVGDLVEECWGIIGLPVENQHSSVRCSIVEEGSRLERLQPIFELDCELLLGLLVDQQGRMLKLRQEAGHLNFVGQQSHRPIDDMIPAEGVTYPPNFVKLLRIPTRYGLGKSRQNVVGGLSAEVNGHCTVQIIIEVFDDAFDILSVGLYKIEGGNPVQLLAPFGYVHVERDVVLSEIDDFEERFEGLLVESVEDEHFPQSVFFVGEYRCQQLRLNSEQVVVSAGSFRDVHIIPGAIKLIIKNSHEANPSQQTAQ